jgi:CobQ-like glutamine amidotransferase family enzyme
MRALHILQLYLEEMNAYGDQGNLLALSVRARRRGLEPVVHHHSPGGELPDEVDIVLGGGGADAAQQEVQHDVVRVGGRLRALVDDGVPMLAVCATYQLFGNGYRTGPGVEVEGIGIFDADTAAPEHGDRLIGNVAITTEFAGTVYGFENHSGRTVLAAGQAPFGVVAHGKGNNGSDGLEGARTRNAFGTYLHGPVLPSNPAFTDYLLRLAVSRTGDELAQGDLDDSLAADVRLAAARRVRR